MRVKAYAAFLINTDPVDVILLERLCSGFRYHIRHMINWRTIYTVFATFNMTHYLIKPIKDMVVFLL